MVTYFKTIWTILTITLACATTSMCDSQFRGLIEGERVADFRVKAVYENDNGDALGARFTHEPSGFVLDLIRIQSVPQALMWVSTPPPSDQGEPHTCEHLLLGKGTRGRYVASLEGMSLGHSSAFTRQLETCYHFRTDAGSETFFKLMEAKLEAMLHPTFSDEEIRREVCNVGIATDPTTGNLILEEKGTVYNEMSSGYERPWSNLGRKLDLMLYGPGHPLSNESGGLPSALRTMTPEDLRKFHSETYHLNNMGMVVSIPDELSVEESLGRFSEIFARVEPDAVPDKDPSKAYLRLPEPRAAALVDVELVGFPHQNPDEPGLLVFAWPPTFEYDWQNNYLLELFVSTLAGGQTSVLYGKFIDSRTRVLDIGASSVFAWVNTDQTMPVIRVGFSNVKRESLTEETIDSVRTIIIGEIQRLAKLQPDAEELKQFNKQAHSRLIRDGRSVREFLNSPPAFGTRGTGAQWMTYLNTVNDGPGFHKKLSMTNRVEYAEDLITSDEPFWGDLIRHWGLVQNKPYAVAAVPDPEMMRQSEAARQDRLAMFLSGLKEKYAVDNDQEAIRQYQAEYDTNTAIIETEAATIEMPEFVDDPPLSLDDQLRYSVSEMPGGGSLVSSRFDNITSSTIGLIFDMYVIPDSLMLYLAALPTLLTDVGVIMGGVPVPYDKMTESIRREISSLYAYYTTNYRTQRVELALLAGGSTLDESRRATEWLKAALFAPDWRTENLPRIRDAVDQALSRRRNTMKGSEESWVDQPADSWWRQNNRLLLTTNCFLTKIHFLQRLRWMLKEVPTPRALEDFDLFVAALMKLDQLSDRDRLTELMQILKSPDNEQLTDDAGALRLQAKLSAMPDGSRRLIVAAIDDIRQSLSDLPDRSLAKDITYLFSTMRSDLAVTPEKVLTDLEAVMGLIRVQDNVRAFMVGSGDNMRQLTPTVYSIVEQLSDNISHRYREVGTDLVIDRLRQRQEDVSRPLFVGLINENTRSGVHLNSATCASFVDSDRETLLTFLSDRLYGGWGAHSMFMKTWGAGLAYSNGLRSNEYTGRMIYYAERCPDLAQTMEFVVNQLKNAPYDASLADYAVAQAFVVSRAGSSYEERAEAMAADLADGLTPEKVSRFRQSILDLRNEDSLYKELYRRMPSTYGRILPGYGVSSAESGNAVYFAIGPEKQMQSWEDYLKRVEGNATLYRLYPRDFWITKAASE